MDCGGLIYELFKNHLALKPFPSDYPQDWALHDSAELYLDFISEYVKEVPAPVIGGLAIFQFGRCFSHAGLVVSHNAVIHAWGRTEYGCVQQSNWGFFVSGNRARPRKFYDVRA